MKKILLPYAIVPGLVLGALTILRAWLEVSAPDTAKFVSVSILSLLWVLCVPALMLRKGVSLAQLLIAGLVFFVLHRLFVGGVYALAWADKWTVVRSEEPVRYVAQIQEQSPDASAMVVFLTTALPPVPFGLVLLLIVWLVTWSIGFRTTRSFGGAVRAE